MTSLIKVVVLFMLVGFISLTAQTRVYVAHATDPAKMTVMDLASGAVIAEPLFSGGKSAQYVALSSDGARAYVTLTQPGGSGAVAVVDTTTNMVVTTIALGVKTPLAIEVTPDGEQFWVTLSDESNGQGSIAVVDTMTNTVIATINDVGYAARAIVFSVAEAFVAEQYTGTVAVYNISSRLLVRRLQIGGKPNGLAITPDGLRLLVSNQTEFAGVFDPGSGQRLATFPWMTQGVSVSPYFYNAVFVGMQNKAYMVGSEGTVLADFTAPAGVMFTQSATTPDGNQAVITATDNNVPGGAGMVFILDLRNFGVIASIAVGKNPNGIRVTPNQDHTGPTITGMPTNCKIWPPSNNWVLVATVNAEDPAGLLTLYIKKYPLGDENVYIPEGTLAEPHRVYIRPMLAGQTHYLRAFANDWFGNISFSQWSVCTVSQ